MAAFASLRSSDVEDFGADGGKDLRLQVPRSPFVQEHLRFDGEAVTGDVALTGELEELAGEVEIGGGLTFSASSGL
jgi:hypothetical protein